MARLHVSQRAFKVAGQVKEVAGKGGVDVIDAPITVSEVARYQGVSRATAWRVLNWMVENGYMREVTHPYKNTVIKVYYAQPGAPMPIVGV